MRPRCSRPALALALLGASSFAAALLGACSLPKRERDELDALDPTAGVRFPVPPRVERRAPERSFDILRIALDLRVDPARRSIEGRAELELAARAAGVRDLQLDLLGLEVRSVESGAGEALAYVHDGAVLRIALPAPLAADEVAHVRISYGGRPRTGLYFSRDGAGRAQVFTHNQPEQARAWFPCVDEPDERQTLALTLRVPRGLEVASGGERKARHEEGDHVAFTFELDFPLPSYLISFAAGVFAEVRASGGGRELVLRCEPEDLEAASAAFAEAGAIHDYFTAFTGVELPWNAISYTLVRGLPAGGMENLGHVLLERERFLVDPAQEGLEDPAHLIAHEAAHQWFGDLVSPRSWSELWISEGFASYLHLLWVEGARGREAFLHWMRRNREDARAADAGRGPRPLGDGRCSHPLELFDAAVYGGAAARLHLLRAQIGAEAFRLACGALLRAHAGRSIDGDVVLATFQRFTTSDLTGFFDAWFRRGGEPELRAELRPGSASRTELHLALTPPTQGELVPAAQPWPAEIEIALGDAAGPRHFLRAALPSAGGGVAIPLALDFEPSWVWLDPPEDLPFRRGGSDHATAALALLRSDDPALRAAGARALADAQRELAAAATIGPAFEALSSALAAEPSAIVRAELAAALARVDPTRALAPLRAALVDPGARVREAAGRALGDLEPEFAVAATLRRAWESEPNPLVRAALLEALGRQRAAGLLGILDLVLDDPERTLAERRGALRALEHLAAGTRRSAPEILERIEPSLGAARSAHERAAALAALERASRGDLYSRARIEAFLRDPEPLVRRAAALALELRGDLAALPALIAAQRGESEPRVLVALYAAGRTLNARADAAKQRLLGPGVPVAAR